MSGKKQILEALEAIGRSTISNLIDVETRTGPRPISQRRATVALSKGDVVVRLGSGGREALVIRKASAHANAEKLHRGEMLCQWRDKASGTLGKQCWHHPATLKKVSHVPSGAVQTTQTLNTIAPAGDVAMPEPTNDSSAEPNCHAHADDGLSSMSILVWQRCRACPARRPHAGSRVACMEPQSKPPTAVTA